MREVKNIEPAALRFRPYPAYKDSGVEWLGEIPEHWQVKRLKTVASVELSNVDKKSLEGEELVRLCNYVDVYYNERITADLDFMAATATREQVRRLSLLVDDVLITKDSESWTDIAIASVVTEDLPGVLCGYHLAHIRPAPTCHGPFLARAFTAIGPRDQFRVAANGITRFGLGGDAIRTGMFAVPSMPEQRAIAAFLDRETARIDALVATKKRLVDLLQEKRNALITRAVTKGLDPTVPMKDSGVEWLGEIPAPWEVKRVKYLTSFTTGWTPPTGREDLYGGEHLWANISDLGSPVLYTTEKTISDEAIREAGMRNAAAGCLLFSFKLSVGTVSLAGVDMYTNEAIASFAPSERVDTGYLYWAAPVLIPHNAQENIYGAPLLNRERIANADLLSPPLEEQRAIAAYLDRETARIDSLVAKVREAIDRLKELRAALIAAAVTGKIDVREEGA